MPSINYHELKRRVSMYEVLHLIDWTPRYRRGPAVRGRCPLCNEDRPGRRRPFSADTDKNMWHCFGCKAHGNQIELFARVTRQTFYQAALDLVNRLDLSGLEHRIVSHKPNWIDSAS